MKRTSTIESVSNDRARYLVDDQTGCWIWKGAKSKKGHGFVKIAGESLLAHRVFYTHFVGQIPDDKEVHHTCFRPACVNPYHLTAITHGEHVRKHSKLDYAKAAEIRRLDTEGRLSHRAIAMLYQVNQTTVSAVLRGETWTEANRILETRV